MYGSQTPIQNTNALRNFRNQVGHSSVKETGSFQSQLYLEKTSSPIKPLYPVTPVLRQLNAS